MSSSSLAAVAAKDIDTFQLIYPPIVRIIPWPVGDLFRIEERLSPVHYVYRTWHFSCAAPHMGRRESPHKLCFHWSVPGGYWLLIADGCVVAVDRKISVERKKEYLMNDQFYIQFDFSGQNFNLSVNKSKLSWDVTLSMNQSPLDEMRSLPDDPLPPVKPVNFAIDATRMMIANGKVNTWYQLSCDHPSSGKRFYVARRYRDFETYDSIIKGYTSRHMRPALPVLPGKVLNPFTNQLSDAFIEERRRALEMYIKTILNNPKVSKEIKSIPSSFSY